MFGNGISRIAAKLSRGAIFTLSALALFTANGRAAEPGDAPLYRPVNYFSAGEQLPTWTAYGGVVALTRTSPDSRVFISDTATGAPLFNMRSFDFDWNVGPDVSLRRRLGELSAIEIRHFHVADLESQAQFSAPGAFTLHANPPQDAPIGGVFDANYASRVYSTELNLRHTTGWVTWLGGFRWIELHENLDVTADLSFVTANIAFDTDNHLYGAQGGADVAIWDRGGPFTINALLKGGIYGNHATQEVTDVVRDPSSGLIDQFTIGGADDVASFVGEIGVTAAYQLTEHVYLRGGYQLFWLTDVALASDQFASIDFDNGVGIGTSGDLLYHGAMLGLEWRH